MSRRVVVAGACIGPLIRVKGPLAAADALVDAVVEASRQPRGHFLRLYRERRGAREAEGIAVIAEAGHRAWDLHQAAIAADGRTRATEGES